MQTVTSFRRPSILALSFVAGLVVSAQFGCGSGDPGGAMIAEANQNNLQRVSNLYVLFQMRNQFRGPADESEFKQFLGTVRTRILEDMGIDPDAIDDVFVSQRDGQPFVIRYGINGNARGSEDPIVFEQVGVEGKRMVAFTSMIQKEVDEVEYKDLLAGKVSGGGSSADRGMPPAGRSGS